MIIAKGQRSRSTFFHSESRRKRAVINGRDGVKVEETNRLAFYADSGGI